MRPPQFCDFYLLHNFCYSAVRQDDENIWTAILFRMISLLNILSILMRVEGPWVKYLLHQGIFSSSTNPTLNQGFTAPVDNFVSLPLTAFFNFLSPKIEQFFSSRRGQHIPVIFFSSIWIWPASFHKYICSDNHHGQKKVFCCCKFWSALLYETIRPKILYVSRHHEGEAKFDDIQGTSSFSFTRKGSPIGGLVDHGDFLFKPNQNWCLKPS